MEKHLDPTKRHDWMIIYDVENGNPNGDPDAGNAPRQLYTGHGLVTDVCIKRKIRNYVQHQHTDSPHMIYITQGTALETAHKLAYEAVKQSAKDKPSEESLSAWMCANYFDVRMFGAVMAEKKNPCGQVRGPMQLTMGQSVDPIVPQELTISRCASTYDKDGKDNKTLGTKWIVPYGLYVQKGFYSPSLGLKTGTSSEDLALMWQAIKGMFELDRAAARGMMSLRKLLIFTHDDKWGNAPAQDLFERVKVGLAPDTSQAIRYSDYLVELPSTLPEGIHLTDF